MLKHHYGIRISNGGEPVRYDEHRPAAHELIHSTLDKCFRTGIDAACGLIEYDNRRIRNCGARYCQKLTLTLREVFAIVFNHGIIAVWQMHDKGMCIRKLGGMNYLVIRCVLFTVAYVFPNRSREQMGILKHHSKASPQIILFNIRERNAVIGYLALLYVVESVQQIRDSGLACAGRTDKRDFLPRLGI